MAHLFANFPTASNINGKKLPNIDQSLFTMKTLTKLHLSLADASYVHDVHADNYEWLS